MARNVGLNRFSVELWQRADMLDAYECKWYNPRLPLPQHFMHAFVYRTSPAAFHFCVLVWNENRLLFFRLEIICVCFFFVVAGYGSDIFYSVCVYTIHLYYYFFVDLFSSFFSEISNNVSEIRCILGTALCSRNNYGILPCVHCAGVTPWKQRIFTD